MKMMMTIENLENTQHVSYIKLLLVMKSARKEIFERKREKLALDEIYRKFNFFTYFPFISHHFEKVEKETAVASTARDLLPMPNSISESFTRCDTDTRTEEIQE